MVLDVEHHYDFGKVKHRFILSILMVGFSGVLYIGDDDIRKGVGYFHTTPKHRHVVYPFSRK